MTNIKEFAFRACNTFLATLDENFIGFELLSSLCFTILRCLTRECDLDGIFLLQANRVLASGSDERRMILRWDLQDL